MFKLIILIGLFTAVASGGSNSYSGKENEYDSGANQIAWWDTVRLINKID